MLCGAGAEREAWWNALTVEYVPRIVAYLRAARIDGRDADEAVADVVASLVERDSELVECADPWPVIRTALRAVAAEHVKRRRYLRCAAPSYFEGVATDDGGSDHGSERAHAEVGRALSRLTELQRLAVDYRIRWGWDYEIVAAALGTSEATARVHVHRGLKRLRQLLVRGADRDR